MQENYQELIDQYRHIEDIRKLRSQHIMDWMRIGMPVGGALFALFSFMGQTGCWLLVFFGWLIFSIPIITWRFVVRHIDRHIVQMYPQMLEIERQLGWTANTAYYYNNLSESARGDLERRLGVKGGWVESNDFRQYVRQCGRRNPNRPYTLLLNIWDENGGHNSVGPRGHNIQNWAAIALVVVSGLAMLVLIISRFVS